MKQLTNLLPYHETIEDGHGAASANSRRAAKWALIYTCLAGKLMNDY